MEEHDYEIVYRPEKLNSHADALSRISQPDNTSNNCHINSTYYNTANHSYDKILQEIQKKVVLNPNVIETQNSITETKDNIAIPITENIQSEQNHILSKLSERNNHMNVLRSTKPKCKEIVNLIDRSRQIFYLVTKQTQGERATFQNIYDILKTLK